MSVLRNPEKISVLDFFIDLANISYIGDVRTYLKAEKKEKVRNVVLGALDYYLDIYSKCIEKYNISNSNELFVFDHNSQNIVNLYKSLPNKFIDSLENSQNVNLDQITKISYLKRKKIFDNYLTSNNFKYSFYNILSGIYSTDFNKSLNYIFEKYKKSLKFNK